jgi:hypothetical protein
MRLIAVSLLAAITPASIGCSTGSRPTAAAGGVTPIAREQIAAANELADLLEGIKDAPSLAAAKPKIPPLWSRLEDAEQKMKALSPTPEAVAEFEKLRPELTAAVVRLFEKAVAVNTNVPGGAALLQETGVVKDGKTGELQVLRVYDVTTPGGIALAPPPPPPGPRPSIRWNQVADPISSPAGPAPAKTPVDPAFSPSQNAREKAIQLHNAYLAEDFDTVADATIPKVVELIGGRAKMLASLQKGARDLKDRRIAMESFRVGEAREVVESGKELYVIVPCSIVVQRPDAKVTTSSYLLGVSSDAGKTWTFIDGAGVTEENLKQIVPNFPFDKLKLPAKTPPVVEEK